MKTVKILLLAALVISFGFSCKKITESTSDSALQNPAYSADLLAASSIMTVESITNELEAIVKQVRQDSVVSGYLSCANVVRTNINNEQKIEISFNAAAVCTDQTSRSGKLTVTIQNSSGNIFVASNGYKVNDVTVSGNYSFQPVTENQKSLMKLVVPDGQLSVSSGNYIKFNLLRKTYVKEGGASASVTDDVIETLESSYDLQIKDSGSVLLVDAEGVVPYAVRYGCTDPYRPRSGKIKFQRSNSEIRYLLLGNGNCSDKATISDAL